MQSISHLDVSIRAAQNYCFVSKLSKHEVPACDWLALGERPAVGCWLALAPVTAELATEPVCSV